ncbi:MAG TPA: hypothetical protein VLN49_25550 [Gemmatimonadaceae bacterium]|nr:hypothetical protein [Gemmatimonadaceae bacterium]
MQLQQDFLVAQQELTLARERASRVERQRAAGVAGVFDLVRAQLQVQERELELQKLALRLKQQPR